jgi:tRNA(adenine34) deaminase
LILNRNISEAYWMGKALEEARVAFDEDEVPVGAVIVRDGILLGRGHNQNRTLGDPTAHAEIIAITAACDKTGESRLEGADIFVTLEPCAMCAGALVLARIRRLYFGVYDDKTGACGSIFDVVREPRLNHNVEVYNGLEKERCAGLLEEFFAAKRKQ